MRRAAFVIGDPAPPGFQRFGSTALVAMLALVFLTGGRASGTDLGDSLSQLLALPLIAWSAWALLHSAGTPLRHAAVALAVFIIALLAVQQLTLPEALWRAIPARAQLGDDLATAGVIPRTAWSLSPLASERSLWSILPALSAFLTTLALPTRHQRKLLWTLIALGAASMVLGFLQLGADQDSILNPYPDQSPMFGGLFGHFNHQATCLGICIVLIVSLSVFSPEREASHAFWRRSRLFAIALAIFMLAALPLTTSRAMFPLTILGLLAIPLLRSRAGASPLRNSRKSYVLDIAIVLLLMVTAFAAVTWLRFDADHEIRWAVAKATAALAQGQAPYGAGVGSFVLWYGQMAPEAIRLTPYFQNHAHNEYVQWWLESGVAVVLALAGLLALLGTCMPRLAAQGGDRGVAVGAWLACLLLLLHSWVDYPLRTPALMTAGAMLLGIVVAQRSTGKRRNRLLSS